MIKLSVFSAFFVAIFQPRFCTLWLGSHVYRSNAMASWGLQVELAEAEQEMGHSLSFLLSPDSNIPILHLGACSAIFPTQEEGKLLST